MTIKPWPWAAYPTDDRLCLYNLYAKDRGRVQGSVLICYGWHGLFPVSSADLRPGKEFSLQAIRETLPAPSLR